MAVAEMSLTEAGIAAFHRDGYVLRHALFAPEEIAMLSDAIAKNTYACPDSKGASTGPARPGPRQGLGRHDVPSRASGIGTRVSGGAAGSGAAGPWISQASPSTSARSVTARVPTPNGRAK